ncbi:MAG: hypothetical protein PF447_04205, partial [Spirochaetaceae bacterium]|nr:hypothetical protein [Spirochaetaceae bacterium]
MKMLLEDPVKVGLNWYLYCSNNPINFVDPTGLKGKNETGPESWEVEFQEFSQSIESRIKLRNPDEQSMFWDSVDLPPVSYSQEQ